MDQVCLRKVCSSLYLANCDTLKKDEIVQKFREFRAKKSITHNYFRKLSIDKENDLNANIGCPKTRIRPQQIKKILSMTESKIFPGFSAIGRAIGVSDKTAKKLLSENGVKVRSRRKIPKVTCEQVKRQDDRLPRLFKRLQRHRIFMDDETYFDLDGHSFYGGERFSFSKSIDGVPDDIRFREKAKFGKKLMLWIAISDYGHSEPYFHESLGAINADIYVKECIEKRLIPMLNNNQNNLHVFWPDLASAHYANKTLDALSGWNVN